MQAIIETLFDIVYLTTVITLGILMIKNAKGNKQYSLFGIMAITLGAGDSFHLVPRAIALCTTGLENYTVLLGIGKFITSITMTVFYVILYYVWRNRYNVEGKTSLTATIYILSLARTVLCFFPQNMWTDASPPFSWAIYRNIPFALLGLIIIVLFFNSAKKNNDKAYRFMWLTIVLSFGFYIPVVLWGDASPLIGMLMIPKTCAYVWTVVIGYIDMKGSIKKLIPQVKPKNLLLIAGLVWMVAGGNILLIGFPDFIANWHSQIIYLFEVFMVFTAFMGMIFYKLVGKHHSRIMKFTDEKVPFYHFFDMKSYLIMIFMITGGILLRGSHLLPVIAIGVIYCGIGMALELAGVLFLKKFCMN